MSATPRLYVDAELETDSRLELEERQAHYLSRVMRLGPGDPVRLFNGRQGEFNARVSEAGKRIVAVEVLQMRRAQEAAPDLWLLFAPVKKSATDLIVEKAVELGVRKIVPVRTRWTNTPSIRIDRLKRIVIEAAEQTERLDLPSVEAEVSLADTLSGWDPHRVLYYCDEAGDDASEPWGGRRGGAPPIARVVAERGKAPSALLVGPEGGFAAEERAELRERPFVRPISLGPRVLRAETAVIAALSVWQAISGDWADKST